MAIRWIDGFEVAAHATTLARVYSDLQVVGSVSTVVGRQGGRALKKEMSIRTHDLVGSPSNTWTTGIEFYKATTNALDSDAPRLAFFIGTDEQIRCEIAPYVIPSAVRSANGFKLVVKRGATTLATSNEFWSHNNEREDHRYIEFSVVIADGVGGSFSAKVSDIAGSVVTTDVTWDSANTSIDTQEQVATGANRCELNTGDNAPQFDNWYVSDDSTFQGPLYIQGYLPDGDGASTDWVLDGASDIEDAWAETYSQGSVAEDDKRVSSNVTTDEYLATMASSDANDIVGDTSTVVAVKLDIHARMETSGDLDLGARWRQGGTTVQSGTINVSSTAMAILFEVAVINPVTTSAWVGSEPRNLELGVINNG